jgi:hypothetical protein
MSITADQKTANSGSIPGPPNTTQVKMALQAEELKLARLREGRSRHYVTSKTSNAERIDRHETNLLHKLFCAMRRGRLKRQNSSGLLSSNRKPRRREKWRNGR